jgi:hypothetical protein
MDSVKNTVMALAQTPTWAYDFCYYYMIMAAFVVIYSMWALVQLFSVPSTVKRMVPVVSVATAIILSGAVSVVLTMMNFWICRSALKPATEKFAVACNGDADCHDVAGVPQNPSLCTCGARGVCGGCVMRNNMEPQMAFIDEFAPLTAGYTEGFASCAASGLPKKSAASGFEGFVSSRAGYLPTGVTSGYTEGFRVHKRVPLPPRK